MPVDDPVTPDARARMLFDANKKSAVIAYILWFFLFGFGVHRMYCGHVLSGIIQLLLSLVGVVLALIWIGYLILVPVWLWALIDALLIPGWVSRYNSELALRLSNS